MKKNLKITERVEKKEKKREKKGEKVQIEKRNKSPN